jgi:hypothetical protein
MISEVIESTIVRILHPLIGILLRNGVAHGTFSDIVRKIYVDAGFEEVERRGQKLTISNVSILTGINRKEVKRLHEALAVDTDHSLKKFNRIVRVLSGWQHDSEFLDEDNEPSDLQLEGVQGSFTALVKRYSGDMPVVAMLNALIDSGNIKVIDNGNIQLQNPNYLPVTDSEKKLNILGIDTAELINTIDHNLRIEHPEDAWFQRKASNTRIDVEALPRIQQRLEKKAQQLLEDIDAELSASETEEMDGAQSISVGIFYSQKPTTQKEDAEQ